MIRMRIFFTQFITLCNILKFHVTHVNALLITIHTFKQTNVNFKSVYQYRFII